MTPAQFDVVWEHVKYIVFCTADEFRKQLDGWEFEQQTRLIRLNNGPEFHCIPLSDSRTYGREDVRACVQPLIDRYGYATTRTPKQYVRQHRFNKMIGFVPYREDDHDIYYRIERLRHV